MATGRSRQDTTINRPQTFSQDQRPRYRIGSVNVPFITPDRMASATPHMRTKFVSIHTPSVW